MQYNQLVLTNVPLTCNQANFVVEQRRMSIYRPLERKKELLLIVLVNLVHLLSVPSHRQVNRISKKSKTQFISVSVIVLDTHSHPTKCIGWFCVLANILAGAGSGWK